MKNTLFVLALAVLAAALVGCPERANSITLHNDGATNITFFSATRIGDVGAQAKAGINVLPQELEPSASFTLSGLLDGDYTFCCLYRQKEDDSAISQPVWATQSIEGGMNYNWYFTDNAKSGGGELILGETAPTSAGILDALLK